MIRSLVSHTSDLFERDETAWLEQMRTLIRQGRHEELDFDNLSEYLGEMSAREKREALSRVTVLMAHRLRWDAQPGKRSPSWRRIIEQQRQQLADMMESAALRHHVLERLEKAYGNAVRQAAVEVGLKVTAFPVRNPYSLDRLLAEDPLE